MKKLREEFMQILGNKCASCGEPYNPHAKKSNLEFDHKFYFKSKDVPILPHFQIKNLITKGIDPNTQFMILCHTCHMIVTHLRKDVEKSKKTMELAAKLGILGNNNAELQNSGT